MFSLLQLISTLGRVLALGRARGRGKWLILFMLLISAQQLLPASHPLKIRLHALTNVSLDLAKHALGEPMILRFQTRHTLGALNHEIDRLRWLESEATVKAERWARWLSELPPTIRGDELELYRRTHALYVKRASEAIRLRGEATQQVQRLEAHLALLDAIDLSPVGVESQRAGDGVRIQEMVRRLQDEITRYGRIVEQRGALEEGLLPPLSPPRSSP